MKHLSLLAIMVSFCVYNLVAQPSDSCLITYGGENRDRTIGTNAYISAECPGDWPHTAPFGNWGVTSNYGHARDANQFAGWEEGTIAGTTRPNWQWNSCTIHPDFSPPNTEFYNDNEARSQRTTRDIESHGERIHRVILPCSGSLFFPLPNPSGCTSSHVPKSWGITENFMSLYELDFDDYTLITTLYFPGTSVPIKNCNFYGCDGGKSSWVSVSRSTVPSSRVDADMRMRVSARYDSGCGW